MPKPVLKALPCLGRHVANEGIREWFVRENWLLTERNVQRFADIVPERGGPLLQQIGRRRHYGAVEDVRPASRSDADPRAASGGVGAPPETAPQELHSA